eukprot:GHVP01037024.1.p1 GENE.GHVP01037024.1~~GHVP01037024.1.p1  ORF type:complete len:677 (-),score=47.03 GHVP01037024.1:131-2161(-)
MLVLKQNRVVAGTRGTGCAGQKRESISADSPKIIQIPWLPIEGNITSAVDGVINRPDFEGQKMIMIKPLESHQRHITKNHNFLNNYPRTHRFSGHNIQNNQNNQHHQSSQESELRSRRLRNRNTHNREYSVVSSEHIHHQAECDSARWPKTIGNGVYDLQVPHNSSSVRRYHTGKVTVRHAPHLTDEPHRISPAATQVVQESDFKCPISTTNDFHETKHKNHVSLHRRVTSPAVSRLDRPTMQLSARAGHSNFRFLDNHPESSRFTQRTSEIQTHRAIALDSYLPRVTLRGSDRIGCGVRVISNYPKDVQDFLCRRFHLPLTTKASTFVQLSKSDSLFCINCFCTLADTSPRFSIYLPAGTELVNNITENGPCLYLISPTSGEFEFQCQRDQVSLGMWQKVFQNLGVGLRTFEDLYQFEDVIGTGSFGKVLVGRHRSTGARVCLKSVPKSHQNVFSFYHEVRIMRKISHPNIVQIYASYEDKHNVHMVMEYCSGGEVFDFVQQRGPLDEETSRKVMKKVLSCVEYLHSIGIIHRDLKTENLLLCDQHDVTNIKLIDFGLSAVLGDQPLTLRCGSPGYVAPEVLNITPGGYGKTVDVFSAGTVLFTLITGHGPFRADDNKIVMKKNAKCEFNFQHSNWRNVSTACVDLVRRMLSFQPQMRPSAREALESPWFTNAGG